MKENPNHIAAPLLEKIASDRVTYSCEVKTLGEAKIPSPIRRHDFVEEGRRVLLTGDMELLEAWESRLGHKPSFERAGPHERIFHDPAWTRVGIVTAGGLCPGLNNVIKGLVEILSADYGIRTIYGIRYGYAGLSPECGYAPMPLDVDSVDTIHELGGTILGSSRGRQPTELVVDTLERMNINILFCIGGDGSLRCAHDIALEALRRKLSISVVGIPKTIDNDLHFVGRSFGFVSSTKTTTIHFLRSLWTPPGCTHREETPVMHQARQTGSRPGYMWTRTRRRSGWKTPTGTSC